MTALSQIQAGSRILASVIRDVAPLAAYKGADEMVSTLTLQNDDALFLAVDANATYLLIALVVYEGGTQGASDFKMGWTIPAGASLSWTRIGVDTTGAVTASAFSTSANTPAVGTNGAGAKRFVVLLGTLSVSSTNGTMQFQWCTNTTPAVNTTVHAGSVLGAWQVA